MRSHFINTSALSHAASGAAQGAAPKADKTIEKVVYMSAEDSLKSVVLNVSNAADATLRLIASMVVHLIVRTYHHNDAERRDMTVTRKEIMDAFQEYAQVKRSANFKNAWVSRLLQNSVAMARSLTKDYDKKGVQEGSPLSQVLRAKTAEKGVEIVFGYIMGKTKGANAFAALEKALAPAARPAPVVKGKGSNAVKASTDKPNRIAKALDGDKGAEIINAIPGNAKSKAIKLADKLGQSNVDRVSLLVRYIGYLDKSEDCLMVSNAALEHMKTLEKASTTKPIKGAAEPAAEKNVA